MKLLLLSVAALGFFGGNAYAQDTPAWEVSGGYRFARQFDPFCCSNLNGFSAAIQENANSWVGGVFEVGASFKSENAIRQQLITFMAGPQFTYRKSSVLQPFVRALIGGARYNVTNLTHDTNLAFGGGGGVDIRMSRSLYFRANADFLRTALFSSVQKFAQGSAGIVYRIGSTER